MIDCDSGAETDTVETTVNAGFSSLSYDSVSGTYTYVWKTKKEWAGTCRRLELTFSDEAESVHYADFAFRRK